MNTMQNRLIAEIISGNVSEEVLERAYMFVTNPNESSTRQNGPDRFLSEMEACEFCGGITRTTLWRWRKELGLKSYLVRKRRLFHPADLRSFVEAQELLDKTMNMGVTNHE